MTSQFGSRHTRTRGSLGADAAGGPPATTLVAPARAPERPAVRSRRSGTVGDKPRVGVLMGGWSGEHEVSMRSGRAVADALAQRGYDVARIVIPAQPGEGRYAGERTRLDLLGALQRARVDVVFVALHGRLGEDGCLQGLLELSGLPYTGAGVLASALAMDKLKSKELFRLHNVPTPPYYAVSHERDRGVDVARLHRRFGFPVIVKPRGEGSSIAVTKAHDLSELSEALRAVFEIDDWALVERYVEATEVNVGILNGEVLGAIEICPRSGMYDYHAKYTPGATAYHMPARLSPARYQGVLNLAKRAADAVEASGAVRVDLLVTAGENEYVLEVNTLPGMTETSLLPKIAAAAGYEFGTLCEAILSGARLHTPVRAAQATVRRDAKRRPARTAVAKSA